MQKISKNVYIETQLRGANHGFVSTKEGVVLIDTPQYPIDAIRWRDEVAKYGPVRYIIHTEPHGDHYGGDYFFEGQIVVHEDMREAMINPPNPPYGTLEFFMTSLKERGQDSLPLVPADFHFRIPTITLSERMTLYLGNHTFHLINHPGHTSAQVAVYIPEERIVFTSDNIFHQKMTFLQAALPYQWLESLKRLEELDVDVLVPGHGPICDKSYIPQQAAIVQSWIDAITDGIKKGLSMEEMQDNPPYTDPYSLEYGVEYLAERLPRMNVERLYQVLKK